MSEKRKAYKKKRYIIPLLILIVLIVFRMYLPTIVKNHINKVLSEIPGYYGQVSDVNISLIRGAYIVESMYLNKVNAKSEIPFLNFPKTDISIEWNALFDGRIVSEVIISNPEVIYMAEDQNTAGKEPDADDWSKALTEIIPIDINNFEVQNGKFGYVEFSVEPNIDLNVFDIDLTANNLRNVRSKGNDLPSTVKATGKSIGGGVLNLDGKINIIKEIPDMDLSFSLKSVDANALNDFTDHYSSLTFNSGTFELFSEIAIADGYLKGYMKPMLSDSELIGDNDSFLETLWEGFVGFFKFVLKNKKTDTLATRIPIEGNLNKVDSKIWPTVLNIFKNGWIKAFSTSVDNDINITDAVEASNDN